MYLTRLTLLDHPDLKAIVQQLGDAYREHQMLWRLFDPAPDTKRDFLYRRDVHLGRPRYFILSRRPPVNPLGLWHIDPPKPFEPKLQAGQKLAFLLRANPVVRRDRERHDIVMDKKKRIGWKSLPPEERPPLPELIHRAGLDWLSGQGKRHGFNIDHGAVRVDGYCQHHTRRGGHAIHFSTLDFTGLLTVTDPELFRKALFQGIGPAKAFGCGLLLVRKV
ncbi:type I-E CRISPR-associated protein Cas6/Cse3/CasE [Hydrogenophilus thermoluteolus]|uniref:type I-E CRISPR-associated protein Cas6/Cse3/CasE n=1 Tax=Hydrogenophilus thermoluteolus TaxID=297 RepID=UPI0024A2884C|nr:type I-E CRISPR-associated protein Cas6/Cse3/CasE [Hydrogenophilus thermoluteolus]GLW59744.1 type I-E CRISPR-associated protein Cas6/Cse3/CasE [Hydrogenophilus thermoluteolus]